MSDGTEVFGIILLSQVLAPLEALNLPSFRSLKLKSVQHRPRGMYPDDWGVFGHGYSQEPQLEETPEMLIIRGTGPRDRCWTVSIDLEDGTFGHVDWYDMMGSEHKGSAMLGIMLFGLPGLLLTSPLWLASNLVRSFIKLVTRRDVDSWFVWFKLFQQLKVEDRHAFWRAWSKEVNGIENRYNKRKAEKYEIEKREKRKNGRFTNAT